MGFNSGFKGLNLGASTFWNPLSLSRPVMGLLYLALSVYDAVPHELGNCWKQYKNPVQHSYCQLFPNGYDSEFLGIIGRSTSVLIIVYTIFTCCLQQSTALSYLPFCYTYCSLLGCHTVQLRYTCCHL